MKTRMILALGASVMVFGGVGGASAAGHGARAESGNAAADAAKATKALACGDAAAAVAAAENAVSLVPGDAGYRLILARSYLAGGRLVSARDTFADTLSLAPGDAKAALNLALMQVATGDGAAARRTLATHGDGIAAADRGLAVALAGDPDAGVAILLQAARQPGATAKVRQNLALALALAGQWPAARTVAAMDLSPADLDARLEQWAVFMHPRGAADQVATLLGIVPVADVGQPARLALGGGAPSVVVAVPPPATPAAAAADPVASPVPVAAPAPASVFSTAVAAVAGVIFGPRREVVQPLPVPTPLPVRVAHARPATARGGFFIQFGAFASPAVARAAWTRAVHRLPTLASRGASGTTIAVKGASMYRLSAGGFSRGEADGLCQRYRRTGGTCFVRTSAGDRIATWTKPPALLASR